MDGAPNVFQTTWSGLPQYVCLQCPYSAAGDRRALQVITSHVQSLHGEEVTLMSEPKPDDEPTKDPEDEPTEPPPEDPEKEPAEVV
ncbi:MAG TPA: hypothetical protein VF077_12575 [Nitrospiraceae bacterium]